MKRSLLIVFAFGLSFLFAQPFTTVPNPLPALSGISRSAMVFADFDGDGDEDLLVTGLDQTEDRISRLYRNNGFGGFSIWPNQSLEGVSSGAVDVADIDNDGDLDMVITGSNISNTIISKLYQNDGTGGFTELTTSPLKGVFGSSADFGDMDGDGDQDLLLTGRDRNARAATFLYQNDGNGLFTEDTTHILAPVERGTGNFADIDGDGDKDVLITGILTAKLYRNDGTGAFTEIDSPGIEPVYRSRVAFADIDSDGDLDFFLTGLADTVNLTQLYENDGTGNFSPFPNPDILPIDLGTLDLADVDGDGDLDLFVTGENEENQRIAQLALNAGDGTFSLAPSEIFTGIADGSARFADIDQDGDADLLITGATDGNVQTVQLYHNTTLTQLLASPLSELSIFPNPATQGKIKVKFQATGSYASQINIVDSFGRSLYQVDVSLSPSQTEYGIDVSSLPSGIYNFMLKTDSQTLGHKLIIP